MAAGPEDTEISWWPTYFWTGGIIDNIACEWQADGGRLCVHGEYRIWSADISEVLRHCHHFVSRAGPRVGGCLRVLVYSACGRAKGDGLQLKGTTESVNWE